MHNGESIVIDSHFHLLKTTCVDIIIPDPRAARNAHSSAVKFIILVGAETGFVLSQSSSPLKEHTYIIQRRQKARFWNCL